MRYLIVTGTVGLVAGLTVNGCVATDGCWFRTITGGVTIFLGNTKAGLKALNFEASLLYCLSVSGSLTETNDPCASVTT